MSSQPIEKIEDRTYKFALRIVRLVKALPKDYASRAIGRQVLRSGTSIGANVEEAIGGSSKRDFANKMAIARKEARETHYWLRLLRDSELVKADRISSLIQEALELKKILSKTVTTTRKRLASAKKIAN
ncbi:MAG: four helix bundle protein [Chloroflexota bacterium]